MYGFRQPQPHHERPPTGGTGIRIGGGRRPGGGDVRYGGSSTVEHTEGSGTTSVTGTAADVHPRTSHGIRDATDCSPFRRPSPDTGTPDITWSGISRIISTWSRLLQDKSVSAAVKWDTRMAHSNTTSDLHRETKYSGRDLTLTGLYVIDSDHASSSPVISDLHSEYSSASTYRGGSTTPFATGHSVQLASQEADILTSATTGDSVDQFPVPDREESGNTEPLPVGLLPITPTTIEEPINVMLKC